MWAVMVSLLIVAVFAAQYAVGYGHMCSRRTWPTCRTVHRTLAVAIGYPDLVQIFAGTVLNQTGQAVEVIAITMAVYLTISLITSALMNLYNRRMALVER